MRTRPIKSADLTRLLRQLSDPARLAVEIAADTGLRISDILSIRSADVAPTMRIVERKTGKARTVSLRQETLAHARAYARYAGEYLIDRDRSTIYRQVRTAAQALGLANVSMHSIRKYYARKYCRAHGLAATQRELQHDYLSTTLIYLIDEEDIMHDIPT